MDLPPDFEELLAAFDDEGVQYVLVGGYAVSLHSRPRSTKDIDLWIGGGANLIRVARALERFGAPSSVVQAAMTLAEDEFVFMGKAPLRVDLIRSIKGLPSFAEALDRSVRLKWGTRTLPVLALDDLITSKRAAGRAVDRRDLRALEATRRRE